MDWIGRVGECCIFVRFPFAGSFSTGDRGDMCLSLRPPDDALRRRSDPSRAFDESRGWTDGREIGSLVPLSFLDTRCGDVSLLMGGGEAFLALIYLSLDRERLRPGEWSRYVSGLGRRRDPGT